MSSSRPPNLEIYPRISQGRPPSSPGAFFVGNRNNGSTHLAIYFRLGLSGFEESIIQTSRASSKTWGKDFGRQ